jgi:uncharacterized protein (DUF433 family)
LEGRAVRERRILGRFVVMDPNVRGGEPSFRGTQLTVREVVEQIAAQEYWETLIDRSEGTLSRRAIAEALALCVDVFLAETERRRGRADQTRLDLGDHIVMDPLICHGKPTYNGSRVMVWQVLALLEQGQDRRFLDVDEDQVAAYIRLLLNHPLFSTEARRLGHVVRVTSKGLMFWRSHAERAGWP